MDASVGETMVPRARVTPAAGGVRPVRVGRSVLAAIRSHAARSGVEECCGGLVGTTDGEILRAVPRPNESPHPRRRYAIGPVSVRDLEEAVIGQGLQLLGFYHSHPHGPASPSQVDVDAAWPWYVYLIVGTDGARAWRLREDRSGFDRLPIALMGARA